MASALRTRPDGRSDGAISNRETTHRHRLIHSAYPGSAQEKIAAILAHAGIVINGNLPWDIQVFDPRFYRRVLFEGSLGAGETYMDGWWEVEALDEFFARLFASVDPYSAFRTPVAWWLALRSALVNRQRPARSADVARAHYNLGNDLYQAMLDARMQYTCAYWNGARTLDEAQERKLHLICRKLHLEPGMSVLELGGGFGGLAHFLATEYRCRVVTYNISHEQVEYSRARCQGLPVRVEERDYREAAREPKCFDRIASIGLCEHIGYKNYRGLFELVRERLADRGLFLLHTIGSSRSSTCTDAWIDRYIFPNGMVPSVMQLGSAMEGIWVVEDWHNFGPDYDPTLMAWWENFRRAWPRLRAKYGERFYRMWRYYLMSSAGAFRVRRLQLWQVVLSKGDIPSYVPAR
jgi:cyclopropane-fatty-acyl-phospholipid synthase